MAKSNYCDHYNHARCKDSDCECHCHKPGETVLEAVSPEQADAEVLKFVETLKNGKQKIQRTPPEGSIDAIAQRLLDLVYTVDPTFQERDLMCAQEWGLTPAQRAVKYIGIVLDRQMHMEILAGYDFLEPGNVATSPAVTTGNANIGKCPQCEKEFERKVPGQICCSNECGEKYFPKPQRKEPEFTQQFNEFIESQLAHPNPENDSVRNIGIPAPGVLR